MNNLINNNELSIDDNYGYFSGYASVFGVQDQHNDVMVKGCFGVSDLIPADIKILWQHHTDYPIGECMELHEDEIGLYMKARILLKTSKGREVYELIKSGVVNGLSVGFAIIEHEINKFTETRIITSAKLWEISLVTFPANKSALVTNVKQIGNSLEYAINRAYYVIK